MTWEPIGQPSSSQPRFNRMNHKADPHQIVVHSLTCTRPSTTRVG